MSWLSDDLAVAYAIARAIPGISVDHFASIRVLRIYRDNRLLCRVVLGPLVGSAYPDVARMRGDIARPVGMWTTERLIEAIQEKL